MIEKTLMFSGIAYRETEKGGSTMKIPSKGQFLRRHADKKTKVCAGLLVLTVLLSLLLMAYGAYETPRKSVFQMPLVAYTGLEKEAQQIETLLQSLHNEYGDAVPEDGDELWNLARSTDEALACTSVLNILQAVKDAKVFVEYAADMFGGIARNYGAGEKVDEAEKTVEENAAMLVTGVQWIVIAIVAVFAIPAVLALLGALLKSSLFSLLAAVIGGAALALLTNLILGAAAAVILLAQVVMCRRINKTYRQFRRNMRNAD